MLAGSVFPQICDIRWLTPRCYAEPNIESPANVDAAKMWRDDRARFNEMVKQQVLQSLELA